MAEVSAKPFVEDWWQEDAPPRRQTRPPEAPHLDVDGFEGPLDFLLEMVRRHKLDLGRLSIIALVDQLVAALQDGAAQLERRADWLVMTSELLRLRAQLLAPASPHEAEQAAAETERRIAQLGNLAAIQVAAAWLAARPQLGCDVFARGNPSQATPKPQAELYVAFLEATLVMLEGREGEGNEAPPVYRPAIPDLWRVPDAMVHIRAVLEQHPNGGDLTLFLPPLPAEVSNRPLKARAVLASTLVAGLELARDGTLDVTQAENFGPIRLQALANESDVRR